MRLTSPIWTCSALFLAACGGAPKRDAPANVVIAESPAPVSNEPPSATVENAVVAAAPPAPVPPTKSAGLAPAQRSEPVATRPAETADYRAIGTEPFWSVSIRGDRLTFDEPGVAPRMIGVSRQGKGDATRYDGEGLAMTVRAGPCSDGMSDREYADQVQLTIGARTFKGCGGAYRE